MIGPAIFLGHLRKKESLEALGRRGGVQPGAWLAESADWIVSFSLGSGFLHFPFSSFVANFFFSLHLSIFFFFQIMGGEGGGGSAWYMKYFFSHGMGYGWVVFGSIFLPSCTILIKKKTHQSFLSPHFTFSDPILVFIFPLSDPVQVPTPKACHD